ncbi:SAM-dependent methyltransferase [Frankia sp. Cas4]|uniref:SAM-dependent methyltransferase n=1 Tax=Frankia sp. Cas4 TaxID=3073927 RepID=UPI002AD544CA|nr:SAM-dependent methyltransferase [Frankia sp. Cas4]
MRRYRGRRTRSCALVRNIQRWPRSRRRTRRRSPSSRPVSGGYDGPVGDDVGRFFDGMELLDPGMTLVNHWHPDELAAAVDDAHVHMCGGIARKPWCAGDGGGLLADDVRAPAPLLDPHPWCRAFLAVVHGVRRPLAYTFRTSERRPRPVFPRLSTGVRFQERIKDLLIYHPKPPEIGSTDIEARTNRELIT